MKIKLKDLLPNPYRDLANYPIDRNKVEELKRSFEQTGFWDNIVARKSDDKYQIAYGHHRLIALRESFPDDHVVDIPVRELSDDTMIQIMANENMEDYRATPKVIDETVRVAKSYLDNNPEIAAKFGDLSRPVHRVGQQGGKLNIGGDILNRFLGWEKHPNRVRESLQRLNLIADDKIDQEATDLFPTSTAAKNFTEAVSQMPIPKEKQKKVARRIVNSGNMGKDSIVAEVMEEMYPTPEPAPKLSTEEKALQIERERLNDFDKYIAESTQMAEALFNRLENILRMGTTFNQEIMYDRVTAGEFFSVLLRLHRHTTNFKNHYDGSKKKEKGSS